MSRLSQILSSLIPAGGAGIAPPASGPPEAGNGEQGSGNLEQGTGNGPNGADRPVEVGRLPNTDSVAGLTRKERGSAKKIAQFFYGQYEHALETRRRHALQWIRVTSIMSGIHYFEIKNGRWIAKLPRPGQIRAKTPLMVRAYRRELGRLGANNIGVTARPRTGKNPNSFARSTRAQHILDFWIDDQDVGGVDAELNEHLLFYGMAGLLRISDKVQKTVRLRSVPGSELFPIPYDARNWRELDGLMRVSLVSQDWLEQQDELFEREHGTKPKRPMADAAEAKSTNLHQNYSGFSSVREVGGRMRGALAIWGWMLPNELNPAGESVFLIGDELFRYTSGRDEKGKSLAVPGDRLPMEPVYYEKHPNDFWGFSFLEHQVAPQREMNRQMTQIIKHAKRTQGFLGYNSDVIDAKDLHGATDTGLVPFHTSGYENRQPPLIDIPAKALGSEVGAILRIVDGFARDAAGHESDIVFGRQEGRTEGGPATNLLNANSSAPLEPVFDSKFKAYKATYPAVLDRLIEVWPESKAITVHGQLNLGRELLVRRDDIPTSQEVLLTPTPLLANGRSTMVNLLFALRNIPADDGKGFELGSREFRRALAAQGLALPGIELVNETEQRIEWRIGMLINDGKQPAIPATGELDPQTGEIANPERVMEDHTLAIKLLRKSILDPAFALYGPAVRVALMQEIKFHQDNVNAAIRVDNVDDQVELAVRDQMENELEARENNPETLEGILAPNGVAA